MIFTSNNVFAQDDDTDSEPLDTIAFKKSLEEKSVYAVTRLFHKVKNKDSLKTAILAKYIRGNYLNSNDLKKIVVASITLPSWEEKQRNLKKAYSLFDKGIEVAKKIKNDSLLYLAYLRKGSLYYRRGDNIKALEPFYKALDIAKRNKDIKREIVLSGNIALIKVQANDERGAISLLLEKLKIINERPDIISESQKLNFYVSLCAAHINIEDYEAASFYCDEGMKISRSLKKTRAIPHFLSAFAEIETSRGNYKRAHELLDETEELLSETNTDKSLALFVKLYRGKTYYAAEKYNLTIEELLELEQLKEELKIDFLGLQGVYFYLAKSYTALGNAEQGIKYHEKASELDAQNDKKKDELKTSIINKFDLVKLKEEIDALEAKSLSTKYLYVTGIILLLLIIIGLIIFNKKQQAKNKKRFAALMNQLEEKRQKGKLTSSNETSSNTSKEKSQQKPAEIDPKILAILHKLDEFEKKELFLSKDSTLVEVAKKIQTNTTYLSKVINTYKEKSFTAYITDLRVDYAIERLSHDRKFRSFTIGAIAQEIGFKRSESFSKAFKVKTGLYPSYFIKEIDKQVDSDKG